MYKSVLAGILVLAIVTISQPTQKASALEAPRSNSIKLAYSEPIVIATFDDEQAPEAQPEEEIKEVKHTVVENDTLSKIAKTHKTTWQRLYEKNEAISHPDVINVGDEIVIPKPDEKLAKRTLPEETAVTTTTSSATTRPVTKKSVATARNNTVSRTRGSSAGNLYSAGYCTWYVKNKRPDLPNNLGNADTWVIRARAQGMATGSSPRAGAVGQRGMHVVYVERVNKDGTVTISEMNHKGLYVITHRTLPASYFTYIY